MYVYMYIYEREKERSKSLFIILGHTSFGGGKMAGHQHHLMLNSKIGTLKLKVNWQVVKNKLINK